jgi:hypothetical protein
MIQHVYRSAAFEVPLLLAGFNETGKFLGIFWKNIQISNYMKQRSVGVELFHADGQTDGQTGMKKLTVAFHNFTKARIFVFPWQQRLRERATV